VSLNLAGVAEGSWLRTQQAKQKLELNKSVFKLSNCSKRKVASNLASVAEEERLQTKL